MSLFSFTRMGRRRQKTFTVVNMLGFSLGLASAISIFLYVFDDLSYDMFHDHGANIARITTENDFSGQLFTTPLTPVVLADALRNNDTKLVVGRVFSRVAQVEVPEGEPVKVEHLTFADPEILQIFSFRFIAGKAEGALATPESVVLAETVARKLFASPQDAIGQEVLVENRLLLKVTGVYADWPEQSHLRLNVIAHFDNYLNLEKEEIRAYLRTDWLFTPLTTYVKKPGSIRFDDLELEVNGVRASLADARVKEGVRYRVQPLRDIHLYSSFTADGSSRQIIYVYIFSFVGLTVVFMACTNFINLSLATSLRRFREISIRKVLGGNQWSIRFQILAESALYVFVSLVLALMATYLLLPYLNEVTGKKLSFELLSEPLFLLTLVVVIVLTGLLAGLIPAVMISRLNVVNGIRGLLDNKDFRGTTLVRLLVIAQFVVASVLMVYTFTINRQIHFLSDQSMGFQKERMIVIPFFMENINSIFGGVDGAVRERMNAFENELARQSAVEAVTLSSVLPGDGTMMALVKSDLLKEEDNVFVSVMSVDYDFFETYRIPVLHGRSFSKQAGTDHIDAYVVNQTAVPTLGYGSAEEALGKEIDIRGKKGRIIGVVRDFNFQGLHEVIRPLVVDVSVAQFTVFSVRANASLPLSETIGVVRKTWDQIFPEKYFEYVFLDSRINENYRSQYRLKEITGLFTAVAILISALGVFGLTAYTTNFYLKEIGIRKIAGASTFSVIGLLLLRQLKGGFIALLIGFPIGYWISRSWLDDFAYHIDISWNIFIFTYAGLLFILVLSTLYHIIKSSRVDPLRVIRSES